MAFFFFFEKSGLIADTETFCFFLTTIFCSLNNLFSFTVGAWMTFELRLLPAKLLYIFATIITHAVENQKKDILFPTLWLFTYSSGRQENLCSSHILLLLALGVSLTQPGPRILHPQSAGLEQLYPQWWARAVVGWCFFLMIRNVPQFRWTT